MAVQTTPRGLGTLTNVLLAQVDPDGAHELASVAGTAGAGLLVCGDVRAKMIIRHLHDRGFRQPLLPDRQRYRGRGRLPAAHPFDANWISWQRSLGLPVIMPDAGYVDAGDLGGLRAVLRNSAAVPGAIAPLALNNWWLYGPGLHLLLSELVEVITPIALIVEHAKDPVSVRRILDGLLAVIRTGHPVIPMRCDSSSVGLLAHGAWAAAYGSTSAMRHLYPIRSGGGGSAGKESAFWPAGMAHHYRDLLHHAVMASPNEPRWLCYCTICRGGRLDRLATAAIYEVRRHNLACLVDLRHQIVAQPTPAARIQTWSSWCHRGEVEHAVVNTGAVAFNVPNALRNWQRV